jgi:FixJ family two-component response regulator
VAFIEEPERKRFLLRSDEALYVRLNVVSPRELRSLGLAVRGDRVSRQDALSPRARQVLGLAVLFDSNKLVAYEIGVAPSTVWVLLHRAARSSDAGCGPHSLSDLVTWQLEPTTRRTRPPIKSSRQQVRRPLGPTLHCTGSCKRVSSEC